MSESRKSPVLLSIVIPAYNAETTVGAAIKSALAQRGAEFEVILVDDGSTDSTLQVAQLLAAEHDRLRVYSQENGGTASALNFGCSFAGGEFLAALGADDELTADYLEVMTGFVREHPQFDIYSHDVWAVRQGEARRRVLGWDQTRSVSLDDLLAECVINGGGTWIRRALFERLAGYRTGMYNEDYDLWLRALAEGGRHIYVPESLYLYHLSSGVQKTSDPLPMYRSAVRMFENIVEHYSLSPHQLETALASIRRFQTYISEAGLHGGKTVGQIIEDRAAAERSNIRRILGKVLPPRSADAVMTFAGKHGWIVRPFRKIMWRRAVRRQRADRK